jgi:hypothetical protein
LSGQIDAYELEYVADLIELGEDFDYNKDIADAILFLANPDINGRLSPKAVMEIMKSLNGSH